MTAFPLSGWCASHGPTPNRTGNLHASQTPTKEAISAAEVRFASLSSTQFSATMTASRFPGTRATHSDARAYVSSHRCRTSEGWRPVPEEPARVRDQDEKIDAEEEVGVVRSRVSWFVIHAAPPTAIPTVARVKPTWRVNRNEIGCTAVGVAAGRLLAPDDDEVERGDGGGDDAGVGARRGRLRRRLGRNMSQRVPPVRVLTLRWEKESDSSFSRGSRDERRVNEGGDSARERNRKSSETREKTPFQQT